MKLATFKQEQEVNIPSVAGGLEALFASLGQVVAIVCAPHPHFDGTMHNKVVTTLTQTCLDLGFSTLRFNYRGVGNSSGDLPSYAAATQDAVFVSSWLKEQGFSDYIWLGFSYGSYVAAYGSGLTNTQAVFTIAPSVVKMPYEDLPSITCPWHMLQGMDDEVIDIDANLALAKTSNCKLHKIYDAGHFFHGKLQVLRETLKSIMLDI